MYTKNWTDNIFGVPDIDDDYIYVSVGGKSDNVSKESEKAPLSALIHCLNFYNLKYSQAEVEEYIQNNTSVKEWYLSPNLNSNVKILIQINKKTFFEKFSINLGTTIQPSYENRKHFSFRQENITPIFSFLIQKIKEYDKEYQEWNKDYKKVNPSPLNDFNAELNSVYGSVKISTVFDANVFINEINQFKKTLLKYISQNEIPKDSIIHLIYKQQKNGHIEYAFHDPANQVFLLGNNFYLKSLNKNSKLLDIFLDIIVVNGEYRLRNTNSFKEFLNNFLIPNVSNSLFQNETVKETYNNIKKGIDFYKDISDTTIKVPGLKGAKLNLKLQKAKDRETISDPITDKIIHDLQIIYPSLETLDEINDYILNKIPINELINVILKCVGIKGFKFEFPKFGFTLPKIPTFEIPDLYILIAINFEEILLNLLKKLIDELFDYILGLLRKICEDAWKPNSKTFPDLKLDEVNYPNYDELLKNFIKDIFDSLTAIQICGLLNGEPTQETLDIINNILDKLEYAILKEEIFKEDSDIILFFKNLGNVIDKSVYCDISQNEEEEYVDPCLVEESINSLYSQIYSQNHKISNEDIKQLNDFRKKRIEDLQSKMSSLSDEFSKKISDSFEISKNMEIDLPTNKNGENVYSKAYSETIKIASKGFSDLVKNLISKIGNNNSYDLTIAPYLPLSTLKVVPELNYSSSQSSRIILDELYKNNPHLNSNFSLNNFINKLDLDIKKHLQEFASFSNKQTITDISNENVSQKQIDILDRSIEELEIIKELLLTNPLGQQLSLSYKFNQELYNVIYKNDVTVKKLEELTTDQVSLEELRTKYEFISNYFRDTNSKIEEYKRISDLINEINDIKALI